MRDSRLKPDITVRPEFVTLAADLKRLVAFFQAEIRRGLAGERSSIAMHPSFVVRPSGRERGRFVVLDLGGTNVRATVLDMSGDGSVRVLKSDGFRLPSTVGSANDLFGPVARFVGEMLDAGVDYTLGFIFAFPMEQTGVRSGRLTKWTKEFAFSGVEGEDVVSLLEEAVRRESDALPALRRLKIGALANDTVSVLTAGARLDSRCDMGLIVATGMNLAVAVPAEMISKDIPGGAAGEMLFNMECGNFSGVRSVQTQYDRKLDAESDTEGQLLEKMVSGRYLGEIVRLTVAHLASRGHGFDDWVAGSSIFQEPYAFTTEHVSDIAYDTSTDLVATKMLLYELGVPEASEDDRRRLREICVSVGRRSARLVAMAIVATAAYVDPELDREHLAAADGSLFRGYPDYQVEVERGIANLLGDRADRIQVAYLRDGSGIGAAVLAAMSGG